MRTIGLLFLATGIATNANADVIVYHNDNPELDQLPYRAWSVPYFPAPRVDAMIDLTRDAFAQPVTSDFPAHAVGFTAIESPTSSSDSLGYVVVPSTPGVPKTSIVLDQNPVLFESYSFPGFLYESIAPSSFNAGGVVGSDSNWGGAESPYGVGITLIATHPGLLLGPEQLISLIGDRFTIGVRFALDGAEHYGFAEFEIEYETPITFRPVRWGYETEAGMPLVIPPSTYCAADLAVPLGELDFSDVSAFLTAYQASEPQADIEQPFGVFSFFDLSKFLTLYNTGCP